MPSDLAISTATREVMRAVKFGFTATEFERAKADYIELLELKSSGASKLLSNLVQADIIEPVSGHGKGKYKFKKYGDIELREKN